MPGVDGPVASRGLAHRLCSAQRGHGVEPGIAEGAFGHDAGMPRPRIRLVRHGLSGRTSVCTDSRDFPALISQDPSAGRAKKGAFLTRLRVGILSGAPDGMDNSRQGPARALPLSAAAAGYAPA